MTVKQLENGKWLCQIDRKGVKRIRKTFDTESAAEIFERAYLDKNKKKLEIINDKRTLKELIDIWYRYHGVNLEDGQHRKRLLDRMADDLGNPVAAKLTASEFLDYRFKRINGDKETITPKTFNNLHSYTNALYNKLFKLKVIDYPCPTSEIDFIKIQERQLGYLSLEQITELFDILKQTSNESVWWIAQICIRTGARWGEAENMTKKQLHNNSVTFEFTKGKKVRTIALDPVFYKSLMSFARKKTPNDRIFTNSYFTFADLLRKSHIETPKGQNSHILRHTYASHFIMNGGNILTLQRILGHSDIKMTMRYAHLAPDHLRDAVTLGPMGKMESSQSEETKNNGGIVAVETAT